MEAAKRVAADLIPGFLRLPPLDNLLLLVSLLMASSSTTFEGTVPLQREGGRLDRLDRLVVEILDPGISRSLAARLIREGRVFVDGQVVSKPGLVPKSGQSLSMVIPSPEVPEPGSPLEPAILYEDEALAVLDKPAGLLMHPNTPHAPDPSVASWLESWKGDGLPIGQGAERPGIVHRLDRGTSGVCLVAFETEAFEGLLAQFSEREIRKEYRALVYGRPRFVSDRIQRRLEPDPHRPGRVHTTKSTRAGTRDAISDYKVLETFDGFAHLRVEPRTGRKHQVRVHLASEKIPILGDPFYRVGNFGPGLLPEGCPRPTRTLLHAHAIAFQHPLTGEELTFRTGLPEDMAEILEFLTEASPDPGEEGAP